MPNQVAFRPDGLHIAVNNSANALFYPLPSPLRVRRLRAAGTLLGLPRLPQGAIEGKGTGDDYALRIGLVFTGNLHPTWLERWAAPDWMKGLAELLPQASVGGVTFWVLSQQNRPGTVQTISDRNLWRNIVAARITRDGPFAFDVSTEVAETCLGVWVQSDGDDTHSTFHVTLQNLALQTETLRH